MNISCDILNFLNLLLPCAKSHSMRLFIVGGAVRDDIMERDIKDLDLIVEGNALDLVDFLPSDIKVKSIHRDFGTLKVEYKGNTFDLASTRKEHYPYSGCLPVVDCLGVNIIEDYRRRDFSINSLYMEVLDKGFKLYDFCLAQDDIKSRTLRVLHDKSYIDDPTRILRGLDFKYRFGFDFSSHDKNLIKEYLNCPSTENSSYDRILSVFEKILSDEYQDKKFREIIREKYYKTLSQDTLEVDFSSINKIEMTLEQKRDFYLLILKREAIEPIPCLDDYEVLEKFSKLDRAQLAYYFYQTKDKNAIKYLEIKDIKLYTNGDDLISLGYPKGRKLGTILRTLYNQKLKTPERFIAKEDEISWIKNNFHPGEC